MSSSSRHLQVLRTEEADSFHSSSSSSSITVGVWCPSYNHLELFSGYQ